MRLSSLLLGVTALLLASTNAAASIEETNTAQQVSGDKISASDDETRGKRFLRTDQGNKWDVEEDDEERVWNMIKLKKTDRLNTRLTSSVKVAAEKLKSGVTLRDIDRLNTRLSKSETLPAKKSGVKLSDADRLNTRFTRNADLQNLKYVIKLRKRLQTPVSKKLAA